MIGERKPSKLAAEGRPHSGTRLAPIPPWFCAARASGWPAGREARFLLDSEVPFILESLCCRANKKAHVCVLCFEGS